MIFELIRFDKNDIEKLPFLELFFSSSEGRLMHYYEPDPGLFVVESPMVIERALAAGYEPNSFMMIDSLAEEMCERFEEIMKTTGTLTAPEIDPSKHDEDTKVPVYISDYETIADMTGVNITRGVLAIMGRRKLPDISEVLKEKKKVAIFDDVENPTNVGALFRSAAALGIEAVVLTGDSSDPLYRRASRVSVGTVFSIPWTKLDKKTSSGDYMSELHAMGYKTVAMALTDRTISIEDESLKQEDKLAILLGNEGYGLSDEVVSGCDYVVKIPMENGVDSLNVAVAGSIAFWELTR